MNRAVSIAPADLPKQIVTLLVTGKGGNYSYKFDPPVAEITKTPCELIYKLDPGGVSMQITNVYWCDPYTQLCYSTIAHDKKSVSMVHVNTVSCLINLGIMLVDPHGTKLYCDPEVINNPAGTFGSPGLDR